MAFLPLALAAQPMLEGNLFLGLANYTGEFTKSATPRLSESNFAAGIGIRHYIDFNWAIRANLTYGKISGDDANYDFRANRGYRFETTLWEFALIGEWEPIGENRFGSNLSFKKRLSPYVLGGVGAVLMNPSVDFGPAADQEKTLKDQQAEYNQVQISVPLGIGLKAAINKQWIGALEFGMRAPFTDYLDGVSQAGNPNANDWYMFGGASLSFLIK